MWYGTGKDGGGGWFVCTRTPVKVANDKFNNLERILDLCTKNSP